MLLVALSNIQFDQCARVVNTETLDILIEARCARAGTLYKKLRLTAVT